MKKSGKVLLLAASMVFEGSGILPLSAANITQAKIEETTVSLSPQLEFILPNGSVDVFLNHELGRSRVDFASKYNFIDNYIHADLNFYYLFPRYFFGLDLSDNIDFDVIFFGNNTIQRSRYVMPYVGYNVAKDTKLTLATKFGNNYTVSVDQLTTFDAGKDVTPSVGIAYNTLDESQTFPKGSRIALDFSRSMSVLGGDYDYTQADFLLEDIEYPVDSHYIRTKLRMGYPLSFVRKPLNELYSLGGNDIMRGYKYREFQGDSLLYTKLDYTIPLPAIKSLLNGVFDVVAWDVCLEAGKVGPKSTLTSVEGFKSSASVGASCVLTLFKVLRTKFNFAVSQAIDMRDPVFYFSISTLSYVKK